MRSGGAPGRPSSGLALHEASQEENMRSVRYCVAMSLDGFIAGREDESDWIRLDPAIDFKSLWASFDTIVMGRWTFE
jgi:riboflavin biosynthesis pyrimidine reductase